MRQPATSMTSQTANVLPRSEGNVAIVEFTGLTGAGKTTLLHAVKDTLAHQGLVARDAYEIILERSGLDLTRHPKLRSLLIDLVAFLPFLHYVTTRKGFELLVLAIRVIRRDAGGFLVTLNLWRNLAKRIGVHLLLTRLRDEIDDCSFVVCDEGTLHIAHNLFVHVNSPPDPCEIADFGSIVPQPDFVIWVRATQEQSIESILRRGHSRVGKSMNAAQAFVEHGHLTFSTLCSQEAVQDKLLVIDNTFDGLTDKSFSIQDAAQAVAAFLRQGPMVREFNSRSSPSTAR